MIFFLIILIVGIFTTLTDLKSQKIYNHHLAIGALLGFLEILRLGIFRQENVIFHILNGLIAFIIGFILNRFAIWRGGDAKLFTLYSFLMPNISHAPLPFSSILYLFANSFIAGIIILLPVFIHDIIKNYTAISTDLFSLSSRRAIFEASITVFIFSWVFSPIYYAGKFTNPAIITTVSFLLFVWGYGDKKNSSPNYHIIERIKKKSFLLSFYLVFGLLTHILLSPDSLSFLSVTQFMIKTTLSTIFSFCIHTILKHFKNYHERVPFAPLLLIGCILSYYPFLPWVTHLVQR